ncbi:hypothetical protein DL771_003036 [Monosporascus sp. 5C6A]|nr:hypothetical protein DL771_003036 [Monosporascus sp. 5C6A]
MEAFNHELADEEGDIDAITERILEEHFSRAEVDPAFGEQDRLLDEAEAEINAKSNHILLLLSRLLELLSQESSKAWEREYHCIDLTEAASRMRDQLRDSIPLGDRANPPRKPRSALEVVYENSARARDEDLRYLRQRIRNLEAELKTLEKRLVEEMSKNWELDYRWRDMREEVWRLKLQLRSSISLVDAGHPPWKPKTGLERALEKKIVELEGRARHPKGRTRSNTT